MKNQANFAGLVPLNTVITSPGQYLTRGGETVTINKATTDHKFGCHGAYASGALDCWHRSGRLYFTLESPNDIISAA
jgi:hypothetical protein